MPRTWGETLGRFAALLGGGGEAAQAATEWVREAVQATWGAGSLHELTRQQRALALQRTIGTLYAIEDACGPGDLAFYTGQRELVARAFARLWQGIALEGPPWRLAPTETERPTYAEWQNAADFG